MYRPFSESRRGFRTLFGDFFKGFGQAHELGMHLAKRDIKSAYRQTVLGLLWAFLLPLVNTITWVFLNGSGIVKVAETDIPYTAYVFSGTMLWAIFIESVNKPLLIANASKTLLTKINFPRESLILSGVYQTVFNAVIKVVLVMGVFLWMGIYPNVQILWLPVMLFSLVVTGTALGVLLSPVGMLYNDVGKSIPLIMQLFMYLTPVVFMMPESGVLRTIFTLNPLSSILMTARSVMAGTTPEYLLPALAITAGMMVLFFFTWLIYRIAMPVLIERMSA